MDATIGRIVLYRSRGPIGWFAPAIISATSETIVDEGVEAFRSSNGLYGVPPLTGYGRVHLIVFTPGKSDGRAVAEDMAQPWGGTFQEWDVPEFVPGSGVTYDPRTGQPVAASTEQPAGSWRWPERR